MRINAAFVLLAWLLASPGVFGAPMEERAKVGAAAKPPAKAPPPPPTNKAPPPTIKTPPPATSKPVIVPSSVSKPPAPTPSAVTTKLIPSASSTKVISVPISSSVKISSTTTAGLGPVSKPAAPSVVTTKSIASVSVKPISSAQPPTAPSASAKSSGLSSSALSSGGKASVSLTSAIVPSASTGLLSAMSSVPVSTGPGSASAGLASDVASASSSASAISASSVPDSGSASASISASHSVLASGAALSTTSVSASISLTPAASDSGSASAPAASGSGSGGSASGSASASATAPAVPSEIPGPPACPAPGSFPPPASAPASSASAPSVSAPSASAPSTSALSVTGRAHLRALLSRASCTDTDSCIEKGKKLFAKTIAATADMPSAKTGDLYAASYAPHATPTTLNTQTGVGRQIFALFTKLRNSGVRLPPLQKPLLAESALQQQVEVSIPGKTAGQVAFDNAYAPGVIVGLNNFREEDSVAQGSQVGWNVVAFEQYKAFRGANPPSDLRFVMRFHIDNAVTIQVLKDVYNNYGLSDQATQADTEWTRWAVDDKDCGNDVVMALLGTDNGKGAAFLLIDYKTSVGNKNIVAIYTRRQEGFWAFVVEYA